MPLIKWLNKLSYTDWILLIFAGILNLTLALINWIPEWYELDNKTAYEFNDITYGLRVCLLGVIGVILSKNSFLKIAFTNYFLWLLINPVSIWFNHHGYKDDAWILAYGQLGILNISLIYLLWRVIKWYISAQRS